jgi:hypothetical protein
MTFIKRLLGPTILLLLLGVVSYMGYRLLLANLAISKAHAEPEAAALMMEVAIEEPPLTEHQMLFCLAQGSDNYLRGQQPDRQVYGPVALTPEVWQRLVDQTGLLFSLADCVAWTPSAELVRGGVSPDSGLWEAGDIKALASVYVQLYAPPAAPITQQTSLPPVAPDAPQHLGYIMQVAQQAYGHRPLNTK